MTIVFIGAGNLACSLAPALRQARHAIVQVFSRTYTAAEALASKLDAKPVTSLAQLTPDAEVYIYALRDEVLSVNKPLVHTNEQAIHVLTAGALSYEILEPATHKGIFYPFQSFSKAAPITNFADIPILTEASDENTLRKLKDLASSVSSRIYESTLLTRARLHLAGVFANNFTNCLYALAEEQLHQAGLPFEVLLPIIEETARKVHHLSPREAQTGPAIRNDDSIMQRHLALLDDERLKNLYEIFSENIHAHRGSNK